MKKGLGTIFTRRPEISQQADCSFSCQQVTGAGQGDPSFEDCILSCGNQFRFGDTFDSDIGGQQAAQDVMDRPEFRAPETAANRTALIALAGFGGLIAILLFRKRKQKT